MKGVTHFGSIFELVGTWFLIDFWRPLLEAVCSILGAKWLPHGRHLGVILGVIFWDRGFSDFDHPYNEKSTFLRSEGTPKLIKIFCFFGGCFWQASGDRFLQMLLDFEVPWGCHLAPKSCLKTRSEKRVNKGGLTQRD